MKIPYCEDPVTKQPSVSLTLLWLSALLMVIFIVLEAFDALQSTSLLDEFFITSVGLYFGRKITDARKMLE